MFHQPVVILGAPRSGTSLLQKIVREHDGFFSVAKESDFIWRAYTHPANHDWRYEGGPIGGVDEAAIEDIHRQFDRYALSARAWRRASNLDIMRYQRSPALAPVLRAGYFGVSSALRFLRPVMRAKEDRPRLVDKAVNSSLFLDLIDEVFPDARYVHVVREGERTVRSMIDGWLNPDRFSTYDVPGGLAIPDYPHRCWNFALPPGWEPYRQRPLADVVAFQWTSLQEKILDHFDRGGRDDRFLRVHLEQLVAQPEAVLGLIADFIGVPWSEYFRRLSRDLPRVNARPDSAVKINQEEVDIRMERMASGEASKLQAVNHALGCS